MDNSKSDNRAETGFILILLPVLTIITGSILSKNAGGWDSIALFYIFLFVCGALCLVPASFGILAFKNKTKKKEWRVKSRGQSA